MQSLAAKWWGKWPSLATNWRMLFPDWHERQARYGLKVASNRETVNPEFTSGVRIGGWDGWVDFCV